MTPEEVADAVAAAADEFDLVEGPIVREGGRICIYLSAAHSSGRTAVIDTDGLERFSLLLDDFHWPEFEYELDAQRSVLRELVELAATHLFGRTTLTRSRTSWRQRDVPALEVTWHGATYLLTPHGRTRTS